MESDTGSKPELNPDEEKPTSEVEGERGEGRRVSLKDATNILKREALKQFQVVEETEGESSAEVREGKQPPAGAYEA